MIPDIVYYITFFVIGGCLASKLYEMLVTEPREKVIEKRYWDTKLKIDLEWDQYFRDKGEDPKKYWRFDKH